MSDTVKLSCTAIESSCLHKRNLGRTTSASAKRENHSKHSIVQSEGQFNRKVKGRPQRAKELRAHILYSVTARSSCKQSPSEKNG